MNTPAICPQCQAVLPPGHQSSLCPKCLLQLGFESRAQAAEEATATYRPRFLIPTPEELASRFPHLEILEQIGHGGMGVVYRARQRDLDRIVALKILRSDIETDRNFADRFQREARAMARLNHPNIVTVYDFGRQDELYYFLMEYIDGTNLRQVEQTGQLTPLQALAIVPQVCGALQYAHEQGVVHRDIKPENILVLRDGRVKIADFGLAKLTGQADDGHLTGTWQVMGTPHYMAPEQVERPTTVDHRADIYSLGVVIYEMLTGELPLGRFPVPSRKVQIDVRLDDVVLRALEKEPDRRYQRVTDVQSAVESIQQTPVKRSKSPRAPLPADPEKLRQHLLDAVRLSSKALVWLGAGEIVLGMLFVFLPPLALLFMLFGALSVWAGLQLRHCENYTLTLAACCISLLPLSPLWGFKAIFLAMALYVLWRDRVEQGFTEAEWADCEVRKSIIAMGREMRDRTHRFWLAITSRTEPVIGFTGAVVTHPGLWAAGLILFWSCAWSLYCLVLSFHTLDLVTWSAPQHQRVASWNLTVTVLGWLCWLVGEVVIIRRTLRWYAARRQSQPFSHYEGPRTALLASMGLCVMLSLLIQAALSLDVSLWGFHNVYELAGLTEAGIILGVFGILCGMSAALIGWRLLRWVTRIILILTGGFSVYVGFASSGQQLVVSPTLLVLLPIILAAPASIWGLWGTRQPRLQSSIVANETSAPVVPPVSPAAAT